MNKPVKLDAVSSVQDTRHEGSAFFDPETLPWLPWVMEGTYFRLLDVDAKTGGFTLLLKVDQNVVAPAHGHLGLVQGIIIDGEFSYEDDQGVAGNYINEPSGCIHTPKTKDGVTIFAVLHGPITGYNDDGSIAAVVDAKLMYEMAKEAGAADHIKAQFD